MKVADIGVPQQPSVDKTQGATAKLRWEVGSDVELRRSPPGARSSSEQWDNSGGAHRSTFVPNANFSRYSLSDLFQHQFSQEFQAVGSLPHVRLRRRPLLFHRGRPRDAATPTTNRWNADGTGYTINSADVLRRSPRATRAGSARTGRRPRQPRHCQELRRLRPGAPTRPRGSRPCTSPPAAATPTTRATGAHTVNNTPVNFPFALRSGRFDPLVTLAWDARATASTSTPNIRPATAPAAPTPARRGSPPSGRRSSVRTSSAPRRSSSTAAAGSTSPPT